jgi:hypothetical protein
MALISKFLHIVKFEGCEDYCRAVCDKIEEAVSAEISVLSYQTARRYTSELMEDIFKTWHTCRVIRGTATRCC